MKFRLVLRREPIPLRINIVKIITMASKIKRQKTPKMPVYDFETSFVTDEIVF